MTSRSLRRALLFLLAAASGGERLAAADLCQGVVQDKLGHPMTALAKPALGVPFADPAFGTRIIRITAVPESEGANAVLKPVYATMPAWNADESKLMLYHRGRGRELYDGRTYQFIRNLTLISPTDIEHALWDPLDPDLLYYPSNYNAVPRLYRYRVSTNASELVRDFTSAPTHCPIDWGKLLSLGSDPQYMGWGPERRIGLKCGDTKFLYEISTDTVLSVTSVASNNAPVVAASGTHVYFDGGVYDSGLAFQRTFDDMCCSGEHASAGFGASGDTYNAVSFDDTNNGNLVSWRMDTGAKTVIVGPSKGWTGYPRTGTHVSASAHKAPGWVAASIVGSPSKAATTGLLDQEVVLANTDTGQVCRVAHHRSVAGSGGGSFGYWAEPHVNVSPSGTRMVWGSDWGGGASVDTYVAELPAYRARVAADFDNDGRSDVLWRNGLSGTVYQWPMNGATPAAEHLVGSVSDTGWEIKGYGDQTGDAKADILWRHKLSGGIYLWPMDGSTVLSQSYVGTVDPAYELVGSGDYDGDGRSDVLWRHELLGDTWVWLMNGAAKLSQAYLASPEPGYEVVASGDFDNDGKSDVLWRHKTLGAIWIWRMNGGGAPLVSYVGTVDPAYEVIRAADFNGDGKADVLWRHKLSGDVWLWLMNGVTPAPCYAGLVNDLNWEIVASGDYDGDRKADVLWRHKLNGGVYEWRMNGCATLSQSPVGQVSDTSWDVVRAR